jgi:hypothetical protein
VPTTVTSDDREMSTLDTKIVTASFLAQLPRFLARARFAFRRVACPQTRADRVAEALALAWKHFVTLSQRGKRPEAFVTTLALRCTQAVKAGTSSMRSPPASGPRTRPSGSSTARRG